MFESIIIALIVITFATMPKTIGYFLLIFLFVEGLGLDIMSELNLTIGSANISQNDIVYVVAGIYFLKYIYKKLTNESFIKAEASETRTTIIFILIYLLNFTCKLAAGFTAPIPIDTLFRNFINSTQMFYFFIPLIVYKDINELKTTLKLTVFLALLFPFCQPFLLQTKLTQYIINGQGTFRLGFGDANIFLAFGFFIMFCWDYKKYLTFIPLTGIMLLAHRSGYIALVVSFFALSFIRGKNIKNLLMMMVAGGLVIGMLIAMESLININVLEKSLKRTEETFEKTGTTQARIYAIDQVINEFQKNAITGISFYENFNMTKRAKTEAYAFNVTHPHNFTLSTLYSSGILGLSLMLTIMFRSVMTAYRMSKHKQYNQVGALLFSAMLFFIIFSLMNTTIESAGFIFWFLCGINARVFNSFKLTKQLEMKEGV